MDPRPVTKADHLRARESAKTDLKTAIKDVKSQLKSPLGDLTLLRSFAIARSAKLEITQSLKIRTVNALR